MEIKRRHVHSSQINNCLLPIRARNHRRNWRKRFQISIYNINTHNDRIRLVKHSNRLQHTWEYGERLRFLLFLLRQLLHMFRESVKEMINDIRRKDFDALIVRICLGFFVNLDVEA